MIEIDQEALCESCERDSSRCEGNGCDSARADYIYNHGLTEDITTFGCMSIGSTAIVINADKIYKSKVISLSKSAGHVCLVFEESTEIHVNPVENAYSTEYMGVYINEKPAVDFYENLMLQKIKSMAINLAKFTDS